MIMNKIHQFHVIVKIIHGKKRGDTMLLNLTAWVPAQQGWRFFRSIWKLCRRCFYFVAARSFLSFAHDFYGMPEWLYFITEMYTIIEEMIEDSPLHWTEILLALRSTYWPNLLILDLPLPLQRSSLVLAAIVNLWKRSWGLTISIGAPSTLIADLAAMLMAWSFLLNENCEIASKQACQSSDMRSLGIFSIHVWQSDKLTDQPTD